MNSEFLNTRVALESQIGLFQYAFLTIKYILRYSTLNYGSIVHVTAILEQIALK